MSSVGPGQSVWWVGGGSVVQTGRRNTATSGFGSPAAEADCPAIGKYAVQKSYSTSDTTWSYESGSWLGPPAPSVPAGGTPVPGAMGGCVVGSSNLGEVASPLSVGLYGDATFTDNTVMMGVCGAEFFNHP
jgi:hypothetical protein